MFVLRVTEKKTPRQCGALLRLNHIRIRRRPGIEVLNSLETSDASSAHPLPSIFPHHLHTLCLSEVTIRSGQRISVSA